MRGKVAKKMRKQAKLSAQVESVQIENKYEVILNRPGQRRNIQGGTVVLVDCVRALYRQIKKYNKKNSGSAVKQPE